MGGSQNKKNMNFDLEKEQQLAFNRLKKAYKDCKKANLIIVNQYGELHAYNKKLVCDFADDMIKPNGNPIYYSDFKKHESNNTINGVDSGRADDENMWMVGLTDKGLEIFNNCEQEEDDDF